MAQQTVGPGIAENYVYGKLEQKMYVLYFPNNPPTAPHEGAIEIKSRDVERCRKEFPTELIPGKFFFFDEISLTILINGKEAELINDFFDVSEEYEVS